MLVQWPHWLHTDKGAPDLFRCPSLQFQGNISFQMAWHLWSLGFLWGYPGNTRTKTNTVVVGCLLKKTGVCETWILHTIFSDPIVSSWSNLSPISTRGTGLNCFTVFRFSPEALIAPNTGLALAWHKP